jgi:hypothetical protein
MVLKLMVMFLLAPILALRLLQPEVGHMLLCHGHLMWGQFEGSCTVVTSLFKQMKEFGKCHLPLTWDKVQIVPGTLSSVIIM